MPAEIDTGGHRVLHCNSRADCPTATSIHVSTFLNDECRTDRTHVFERIDNKGLKSQGRASKEQRRKTGNYVKKADPLNCKRENPPSNDGESSPTRVPRIGDEEETILDGHDFLVKSLQQPSRWRRETKRGDENEDWNGLFEICCVLRKSPRAIEDVTKAESFSVTWNSQKNIGDEIPEWESQLRDEAERYRFALADANGSSIARHRSLRDRSRTRPRLLFYESKVLETDHPTDHPEGTRTAEGNPLLSSHHSCTRAKDEIYENDFKNVDEKFLCEKFGNDDTRIGENGRLDCSERCDEHLEDVQNKRIGQDFAERKRIRCACRVYSFLQLAFLLFLIAFGRLGSSNVRTISARPIANGLSVLGIGIVGAVNARSIDLIGDAGTRAERSANLSHISGPLRKIRMFIKNRYLQILPDSTVNGTYEGISDYTIFQRISTSRGQLRIQSTATCLFVCMDSCGLLYGSNDLTALECLFKEDINDGIYNTYSSVRWSTANKTLYLGLNRHGQPRRVQAKGHNLGKLSTYARVLTQRVGNDTVHKIRHHGNSHRQIDCPSIPLQEKDGRDRFRCRKRKKRKKRKRRCKSDEQPGPQCQVPEGSVAKSITDIVEASSEINASSITPESKRSCEGAASEEACRRQALSVPAKKRKSRIDDGSRNFTLGKNKASTSNTKKPNISVADSQSKKPDLTDGKKKKKKRMGQQQTNQGSIVASPSRKRYELGTMSSSRASSLLMALASEEQRVSTVTLSSSPSLPGASTALFSIIKPSSPLSDRNKLPPSSKNHVMRLVGSRRIGKFFPGIADLLTQSRSMPAISATRSKVALSSSTTKVPVDTCAYTTTPLPQFSPISSSSSLPWQESDEDSSTPSYSSLDEESSSTITSELAIVTVESSTLAASDEVTEITTFRLDENCEDSGCDIDDTILRATRFPLERLAM